MPIHVLLWPYYNCDMITGTHNNSMNKGLKWYIFAISACALKEIENT